MFFRRAPHMVLLAALALARPALATEGSTQFFPAIGGQTATLSIHAATDLAAMEPLIHDFQSVSPNIAIEYVEYVTNDLNEAAIQTCWDRQALGDLLLSSSVDQLVKLANDGCALSHRSPQTEKIAKWANWRDEVFGFTFEPSVFVYHSGRVPEGDVPRTHAELADLLRNRIDKYRGRIGTYDIRLSGIGYLLAYSDAQQTNAVYGRLLESMSRAEAVVRCCNSEILEQIQQGQLDIGFNILGSYAYAALLRNRDLKIVVPQDYALVLSRGALIPKRATHAELAGQFLDYLLSERGQRVSQAKAFFFSPKHALPDGVDGPESFFESGVARPIRIGPVLLAAQDKMQREKFIADWSELMAPHGNGDIITNGK